jgi:Peptidase A4 family
MKKILAVMGTLALAASALGTTSAQAAGFGPLVRSFQGSNWGGYVATGSKFTTITGSWTEPQVTCNTYNDLFAPWVGVDGYGSQSVEQTGVQTDCSSGAPVFSAWYEMYPKAPVFWSNPVSAGDSFTGTVTDNSGRYTITLTDNTRGWTVRTQQTYRGRDASAEAVIESPTQSYPSFSQLNFSGITVNGRVFDSYNPFGLSSGQYAPTALQNGAFSLLPDGFIQRPSSVKRPAHIRY